MSSTSLLSFNPQEYQRFWNERLIAWAGELWRGELHLQHWECSLLQALDAPDEVERLLVEYGLPSCNGAVCPSSAVGRIISTPALLQLPRQVSDKVRYESCLRSFAGRSGGYCFKTEGVWPIVGIDGDDNVFEVSPSLRALMETMLVWERHIARLQEADARCLAEKIDEERELAWTRQLLEEMGQALVAVGAIPNALDPMHNRSGYWAEMLDWLRIECLGADYD